MKPQQASNTIDVLGDKALAEAVRRGLRDDAATTALDIEVEVWDRVAHLRGAVANPEDVDAAEAVAARVPGIGEVADDLALRMQFSRVRKAPAGGT
jgi:osmotically-inducible protein OsmY